MGGTADVQILQIVAGSVSSFMFMTGSIPMLMKAFRTKNLHSYSLSHMLMDNAGNLVHWLYISSLPLGPIWLLHTFYTLTTALMLVWYLRYECRWTALRGG